MANGELAVQLYTVRESIEKNFLGTLQTLKKIGYSAVELAGFGSAKTAEAAASAIKTAGLSVCGAHVQMEQFEKDLAGVVRDYRALGCSNVIVPWMAAERRKDRSGWKEFAKSLNTIGAAVAKEGMQLGYHNHSFEFAMLDKGVCGMDILIGETDPANLKFELDCFWVVHGGRCPTCFIRKHAKRLMTLHLKDMSDPDARKFANVGTGLLDFPAIVSAGREAGVRWFVVERDDCYGQDPMAAVQESLANLRAMKLF